MDDRRLEFSVGVLVLAAVGVAIILMFIFGAYPVLLKQEYPVTANFPSVAGIDVDTPVVKYGYPIGRVSDIRLGADGVDVTMFIDAKYPLRKNEIPRIGTQRLVTGEARIEFVDATDRQLVAMFDGKADAPPDGQLQPVETALAQSYVPTDGYYIKVKDSVTSDPFAVLMSFGREIRETLQSIEKAETPSTHWRASWNRTLATSSLAKESSFRRSLRRRPTPCGSSDRRLPKWRRSFKTRG
ncbi:MAG: MlaD family protein [Pirellulaceae bacterium]